MKLAILLLSYFAIAQSQISNSCPTAEDIKPCFCFLGQDNTPQISCNNLTSAEELVKVVSNMKGYSISSFELEKSNIGILPSDVFRGIEINYLSITTSNLTRLGDSRNRPPFLGLENSLKSIQIIKSFLNKNRPLASLSLSHLKRLSLLHLDGNIIPTIGNNWFENGPYGLKQLHLLNTNTSVVGSHAFEALENLEYFSLTGGLVSEITRDMFPMPASSLRSIDLRANKISTFPADIFSKMPSLVDTYLESNSLTTIDEIAWSPIWSQLEYVFFHGNPIRCDSNLRWIYKYRLPEHFKGYCSSPPKLRNRNLSNITISDLEE